MTPTPRYPAALHLKVTRDVTALVKALCDKYPEYEDRSMEINFFPVAHTHRVPFLMDEADETPVGADAVADVEDMA